MKFEAGSSLIYATDGQVFHVAAVDSEIPNVLLDADFLLKAALDKVLSVRALAYGDIELCTQTSVYRMRSASWETFPELPCVPLADSWGIGARDWAHMRAVLHAASDEPGNLAVVCFGPEGVEAFDRSRFARVALRAPWELQFPVRTIQKISARAGAVSIAQAQGMISFRWDDFERIAHLVPATQAALYPQISRIVPQGLGQGWFSVSLSDLKNAIKQASAISDLGVVALQVSTNLEIRAWQTGGVGETFFAALPIDRLSGDVCSDQIIVSGKYLGEALREVDTSTVILSYRKDQPLRLDSGLLTACIWQMQESRG